MCRIFVRAFNIDMSEAELPVEKYPSIGDLFIRKLRPDARPIRGPVCSPADGMLCQIRQANQGNLAVQIKSINYSLSDLVFGPCSQNQLDAGWYFTVYLAPHNYHRVHGPASGHLRKIIYHPGTLWPVNQRFCNLVPQLFVKNERLVFEIALDEKDQSFMHVVMVGALNVGKIKTSCAMDFFTNDFFARKRCGSSEFVIKKSIDITIGQELGIFMMGSTVVTVFNKSAARLFKFQEVLESKPIKMGESLAENF